MPTTQIISDVRIDKWLWAARFYKTRQLATEAVNGGHVHLNGERVKPSKKLKGGERLVINKAGLSWEVDVLALIEKRVSAKLAAAAYQELESSQAARLLQSEQRRLNIVPPAPRGKPDKHQRRKLSAVKQQGF